jgi:hypothetical protein
MLPADQVPPGPDYLLRRLAELERRLREMEGERRLPASQVGAGGITVAGGGQLLVKHANGATLLQAGPGVDAGGNPVEQVIMNRPDGTVAFWCWGSATSLGFTALYDRAGNLLWADDPVVGQGLAKPYFPCGSFESMSTPTDLTAGGAFVALQKAVWRKQHPRIRPVVLAQVTSTTAEIRWTISSGPDTGTVIGGPITLNNGTASAYYGPFDVPGAHLAEFEIDLEGRVASGVGTVAVRTLHAIGIQA